MPRSPQQLEECPRSAIEPCPRFCNRVNPATHYATTVDFESAGPHVLERVPEKWACSEQSESSEVSVYRGRGSRIHPPVAVAALSDRDPAVETRRASSRTAVGSDQATLQHPEQTT